MCHCLACQKRTGSTYGVQARWPRDRVTIDGEEKIYVRVGDEGGRIAFRFCPQCGATVYYQIEAIPDFIAVPVGAFADPNFPPPRISVYDVRKHPWVSTPDDAEHID